MTDQQTAFVESYRAGASYSEAADAAEIDEDLVQTWLVSDDEFVRSFEAANRAREARLKQMLQDAAFEIVEGLINKAKSGQASAVKLVLDQLKNGKDGDKSSASAADAMDPTDWDGDIEEIAKRIK